MYDIETMSIAYCSPRADGNAVRSTSSFTLSPAGLVMTATGASSGSDAFPPIPKPTRAPFKVQGVGPDVISGHRTAELRAPAQRSLSDHRIGSIAKSWCKGG